MAERIAITTNKLSHLVLHFCVQAGYCFWSLVSSDAFGLPSLRSTRSLHTVLYGEALRSRCQTKRDTSCAPHSGPLVLTASPAAELVRSVQCLVFHQDWAMPQQAICSRLHPWTGTHWRCAPSTVSGSRATVQQCARLHVNRTCQRDHFPTILHLQLIVRSSSST
jgi:hypothetical protein